MWGRTVHGGDVVVVVENKSEKNESVSLVMHPFGYEGDFSRCLKIMVVDHLMYEIV